MVPLYRSRRFWLGVLDLVVSFVLLLFGVQWPQYLDLAKTIVGYLQPLVVVLIIALTIDDTLRAWFAHRLELARLRYEWARSELKTNETSQSTLR